MRRVPTIEQWKRANSSQLYALLWPTLWATREFVETTLVPFAWWYRKAYHFFDLDVLVYALWFLIPIVRLGNWWARKRWIVERTLRHRIFIVKEGHHCSEWKLAPVRKWGWKRDWHRMAPP